MPLICFDEEDEFYRVRADDDQTIYRAIMRKKSDYGDIKENNGRFLCKSKRYQRYCSLRIRILAVIVEI